MGILDTLVNAFFSLGESTVRQRNNFARDFERKNPNMSTEVRRKFDNFNAQTDRFASKVGSVGYSTSSSSGNSSEIMGKTVSQWDSGWKSIGMLKDADLTPYNHCVGLYRHVVDGTTKYVGRAIELHNGGFRKRLSDYRRDSDSARKHRSGKTIYENLDSIHTYILVVGDTEEAVEATKKLEGYFIRKYNPEWNRQINI